MASAVPDAARAAFIEASVWHGDLQEANALLAAHPGLASCDLHTAAVLGDDAAVSAILAVDPTLATQLAPPLGWDALTHLCFSRYLRLDPSRSGAFMRAARALLEAGASANTGFWEESHEPEPCRESALYGAAGVAHHPELTRLLLDWGADPNDEEVAYHAPETYDNRALQAVVETGKLTADNLATMLLRKADWHDYDGMRYLLEHGSDPNRMTRWGLTALHQAIRRDNALSHVELLLNHGADPSLMTIEGKSAAALAARRGRGDILTALQERGHDPQLNGVEALAAACARNDAAALISLIGADAEVVRRLVTQGGGLLVPFAGNGNVVGVACLLDLGVAVDVRFEEQDGYYDVTPQSTPLHAAAWRSRPETVKLLIDCGADVNALDSAERTPLQLAVSACVDSFWTERRTPESVAALLAAGASTDGVPYPTGYAGVDELLATPNA
jgi:ankyrin repeat protein